MKTTLTLSTILLLLLLFPQQSFTQELGTNRIENEECATVATEQDDIREQQWRMQSEEFWEQEEREVGTNKAVIRTRWIDVKCIRLRQSNGQGGIKRSTIDQYIAAFNAKSEVLRNGITYRIKLRRCGGVININDNRFYQFNKNEESALRSRYFSPNRINIYFAHSVQINNTYPCGYAYYPGTFNNGAGFMVMSRLCGESTFIHEMGHVFSLRHTHDLRNGRENVARTGPNKNCQTAGDGFCDTPADPNLSNRVTASCVYTGFARDAVGVKYVPNTRLFMSYSNPVCRTRFTGNQRYRMYQTATSIRAAGNRCNVTSSKTKLEGEEGMSWAESLTFELFPNPAWDRIKLRADFGQNSYRNNLIITIYDLRGQIVKTQEQEHFEDEMETDISLTNLSPGMYLMMISDGQEQQVLRFTKQ